MHKFSPESFYSLSDTGRTVRVRMGGTGARLQREKKTRQRSRNRTEVSGGGGGSLRALHSRGRTSVLIYAAEYQVSLLQDFWVRLLSISRHQF